MKNNKPNKSLFMVLAFNSKGESHTYIVGIYSFLPAAMSICDSEEDLRGGDYTCQLIEIVLNKEVPTSFTSHRSI